MKRQFEGCIEYLVIADYHSVTFNIQAGEVVTILGMDGEGNVPILN
jgi:ABC-type Na+ transport system ATPase subunit NatA